MSTVTVNGLSEFIQAVSKYRQRDPWKKWCFRGQANSEWSLQPRIARVQYSAVSEKQAFREWKRRAAAFMQTRLENDWEYMPIAQHHGFATRLMDWTLNPLIAAYFAVFQNPNDNGVVYAALIPDYVVPGKSDVWEPADEVRKYRPNCIVPRIVQQNGLFTVSGDPTQPIDQETEGIAELDRLVIPSKAKELFCSELSFIGVNAATLFPDLDGLSQWMNWTIESKQFWHFEEDPSADE